MIGKRIFSVAALIIAIALTGCNLTRKKSDAPQTSTQPPAVAAVNTPIPADTPTPQPSLCDNLYQPAREGNVWVYSGSNTALPSYTRTDTIKTSRYDSYSTENNLAGIVYNVDYTCSQSGITSTNPVQQYLGALLEAPGSQVSVTLNSTSGTSLPATINPGDKWQQTADVDARINDTGASGWIIFDYTAVGLESITVPAGTYNAMRVDLTITIQVTPLRITAGTYHSTIWMAPNVGIVKTESTSNVPNVDFSDTMQLTSYTPAP